MPQITFDITDAQLKELDDLNAARNAKRAAGAKPSSRQSFAAEAVSACLLAAKFDTHAPKATVAARVEPKVGQKTEPKQD